MINIVITTLFSISLLIAHGDGDDSHNHGNRHSHGGHGGPPKIASIKGTVINSSTKDVVSYASISVFRKESKKLVQGVVTDDDGYFNVNELPPGQFFLTVEFTWVFIIP